MGEVVELNKLGMADMANPLKVQVVVLVLQVLLEVPVVAWLVLFVVTLVVLLVTGVMAVATP